MIERKIIVRGKIKKVYFSNTYYAFANTQIFANNDEVNKRSLLVYKKGTHLYHRTLEYKVGKYLIKYEDEVYYFIEKEQGDGLYVLLTDIVNFADQSPIKIEINIPSYYTIEKYHLINTYEAFMEYSKAHGYPLSIKTNSPLFGDFIDSLFSMDFSQYPISDFFEFFIIENKFHPQHYFHFLVFEGYLCLTDYQSQNRCQRGYPFSPGEL